MLESWIIYINGGRLAYDTEQEARDRYDEAKEDGLPVEWHSKQTFNIF